jgi:hypothetical protein
VTLQHGDGSHFESSRGGDGDDDVAYPVIPHCQGGVALLISV